MFLTISSNDFDPHHIIISDKTKNNIMAGSDFYRLIYSNSLVSTNGVFIQFNLKNIITVLPPLEKIQSASNVAILGTQVVIQSKELDDYIKQFSELKDVSKINCSE